MVDIKMDDVNTAAIILSMQCETYVPELYPNIHHRHGNNIGICDVIMCDVISRCFISCEHSGILLYFMVLYLYIYFIYLSPFFGSTKNVNIQYVTYIYIQIYLFAAPWFFISLCSSYLSCSGSSCSCLSYTSPSLSARAPIIKVRVVKVY